MKKIFFILSALLIQYSSFSHTTETPSSQTISFDIVGKPKFLAKIRKSASAEQEEQLMDELYTVAKETFEKMDLLLRKYKDILVFYNNPVLSLTVDVLAQESVEEENQQ